MKSKGGGGGKGSPYGQRGRGIDSMCDDGKGRGPGEVKSDRYNFERAGPDSRGFWFGASMHVKELLTGRLWLSAERQRGKEDN